MSRLATINIVLGALLIMSCRSQEEDSFFENPQDTWIEEAEELSLDRLLELHKKEKYNSHKDLYFVQIIAKHGRSGVINLISHISRGNDPIYSYGNTDALLNVIVLSSNYGYDFCKDQSAWDVLQDAALKDFESVERSHAYLSQFADVCKKGAEHDSRRPAGS